MGLYNMHLQLGTGMKTNYAEEIRYAGYILTVTRTVILILMKDIEDFMAHRGGKERLYRIYK
jgi:hypothetical protein